MTARELVGAGRLAEALPALQAEIRRSPGDQNLRVFLFQLNCLLGQFDKALAQLQVAAGLDPETEMLARIFQPVILCELLRRDVFAGTRSPLIFGEPEEWMGWLLQANVHVAKGQFEAAAELRQRALDAAPASDGRINGVAFEWIADADSRLGPLLEVILEGKYYWIPFSRIARIETGQPADLRDLVWLPARFTWTNGGAVSGHIPVRYPGTEATADDALRLARGTAWREVPGGAFLGLGQRLLTTDQGDSPLLECRAIEFGSLIPPAPADG